MMSATKKSLEVAEKNDDCPMPDKSYIQKYSKMGRGLVHGKYLPKINYKVMPDDEDLPPGVPPGLCIFPKPKHLPKFDEERAKLGPVFAFYDNNPRKDVFPFTK